MRGSLLRRQYFFIVIILALAVAGVVWIFSNLASKTLVDETSKELRRERILFEELLCDTFSEVKIDSIAKHLGARTGIRFTVILPDGRVIADSEKQPAIMENHADRPEIIAAVTSDEGVNVRYSETLRHHMVYSAGLCRDNNGKILYVIRTSKAMNSLERVNSALTRSSIFWGAILIAIASVFVFALRKYVRGNIEKVSEGVVRIALGDFSARLESGRYSEFQQLEKSVNTLADNLESAFGKLQEQRRNLMTILQSLGEGVIVIDSRAEILLMNETAHRFLELDFEKVRGKDILSTLMIPEFRALIQDEEELQTEFSFGKKRFEVRKNFVPQLEQTVFTINDVTESHIIQQTKADFVANVSHELKTPLTLIKGFTETLDMEPFDSEVKSYIATIMRHTDRMIALVRDLLTLSRIEQTGKIEARPIDPRNLIEQMVFLFKAEAKEKEISIHFEPSESCPELLGDESMLEIALSNLIDNAIKYTPKGGEIRLEINPHKDKITIAVADNGIGIPLEDQNRIFERFYTVDKSRSNSLYGTGLGLSIVKHIAMLHFGEISVESHTGSGSRFELTLPAKTRT
jgi:two-component system phosphate regulon sensor histidine kinase PhoR